jgi:hypothetical protein
MATALGPWDRASSGMSRALGRTVPFRLRIVLAGLPLATGAGLAAYLVLGVPLPVAATGMAVAGVAGWIGLLPALETAQRRWLIARCGAGLRAGALAILAYDATRYGVVAVASLSFEPFHVFSRFGQALLGSATGEPLASAAGAVFHIANGLGFAIAYALAIPRPTVRTGIAWALCLEVLMLALYPAWLGVSLAGELLPVSLAGHVAFGATLGVVTRRIAR